MVLSDSELVCPFQVNKEIISGQAAIRTRDFSHVLLDKDVLVNIFNTFKRVLKFHRFLL